MIIYYVLIYLTISYIVYIVNLKIFNDKNFVMYGLTWPVQVLLLIVIYTICLIDVLFNDTFNYRRIRRKKKFT